MPFGPPAGRALIRLIDKNAGLPTTCILLPFWTLLYIPVLTLDHSKRHFALVGTGCGLAFLLTTPVPHAATNTSTARRRGITRRAGTSYFVVRAAAQRHGTRTHFLHDALLHAPWRFALLPRRPAPLLIYRTATILFPITPRGHTELPFLFTHCGYRCRAFCIQNILPPHTRWVCFRLAVRMMVPVACHVLFCTRMLFGTFAFYPTSRQRSAAYSGYQ